MDMDLLNLNLYSLYPYVIDAFSHVFDEEYREYIQNRLKHTVINVYNDVNGLDSYIYHMKSCKNRELSLKFLEKIEMDVEKYKRDTYTEKFDASVENMIEIFLHASYSSFSVKDPNFWTPICAFDPNNNYEARTVLKHKVQIINFLRNNKNDPITEENLADFSKTEEYQELLKKINQIYTIYKEILEEYNDWCNSFPYLKSYEFYVSNEGERKEKILEDYKNMTYRIIISALPPYALEKLQGSNFQSKLKEILGELDLSYEFYIEFFKQKEMEKLKSPDVNFWQKYVIVKYQSLYLKAVGITLPFEKISTMHSEEDIKAYLDFISQEDIQKLLPSEDALEYIGKIREKYYEEAIKKYFTSREDFIEIMRRFTYNRENIDALYDLIKKKSICILSEGQYNEQNEFVSLMFFTIRSGDHDKVAHNFLHESGHAIEQNENGTGFEIKTDYYPDAPKNPYDSTFRMHEKFNEIINDIFAIEALDYLNEKGIYLITPKEFTALDTSNHNTFLITKDLLRPLIKRFRSQVIKAKVTANPSHLIQFIGKENYEDLNDVVNKVDHLCRQGLEKKLKEEPNDAIVLEYHAELEKLHAVYDKIDAYYEEYSHDENRKKHI